MSRFTESVVEEAALEWLEEPGYAVLPGPDIAAGEYCGPNFHTLVLEGRLRGTPARPFPFQTLGTFA